MAKNKVIYGNTTLIDLTDATLDLNNGASNILSGESAYGRDGEKITGTCTYDADTSDANATASEILLNKTAYVNGSKITGTMPNNGGTGGTIDDLSTPYTIPQGYSDGSAEVSVDPVEAAKIIPSNIKDGVQILGITGTYTGEGVTAQTKSATPYTTAQSILPDSGYDYLAEVDIAAIYYNETANAYGTTVTIGTVAP